MNMRIILSGGGTGGHIYPAVSVAEALERKYGERVEILFVGAEGKMEMEKIPALGYRIVGLPVAGLQRRLALSNFALPVKVWRSLRKASAVIRAFKPDVVAGFGGYASAPVLWTAQRMGIPTLIQEQNSYPGLSNKILAKKARRICVAYDGMDRFFPAGRIVKTGNPLRGHFDGMESKKEEALRYFGLTPGRPVVLILGGSLGTRTLNEAMLEYLSRHPKRQPQFIWQTGKFYEKSLDERLAGKTFEGVWRGAFIERMDLAFAAADVAISRAGASTVSELCLLGKPTIFVPSPNVTEDHQTKNALALVRQGAAVMVPDDAAMLEAIPAAIDLLNDPVRLEQIGKNILALGIPDSADRIVAEIERLLAERKGATLSRR